MSDTIERSQVHATFVIERAYPVPVSAVWHALSVNDARDQWFGGGPEFAIVEKSHDFRVDGHGVEDGRWQGGPRSRFVSTYTDIVDGQRMVFTYDMWIDGRHISTSLTTIAVEPDGEGTRLTFTEQAVHLDGLDSAEGREEGTAGLLDNLGSFLTRESGGA
jgi:uncharacterized protein YndB with AHSA1/START domain